MWGGVGILCLKNRKCTQWHQDNTEANMQWLIKTHLLDVERTFDGPQITNGQRQLSIFHMN